jgi:hypothetical protein
LCPASRKRHAARLGATISVVIELLFSPEAKGKEMMPDLVLARAVQLRSPLSALGRRAAARWRRNG